MSPVSLDDNLLLMRHFMISPLISERSFLWDLPTNQTGETNEYSGREAGKPGSRKDICNTIAVLVVILKHTMLINGRIHL